MKKSLMKTSTEPEKRNLAPKSGYRSRLKAFSTLIKISTAVGSIPSALDETLQFLVEETRKLFDASSCAIFLTDVNMNLQGVFSTPSQHRIALQEKFKNTRHCFVVRDQLPFVIQDAKKKPKWCRCVEFDETVGSYACLPVSTGTRLVGVLLVSHSESNGFPQDRLEMMLSVASMGAAVIQREQLFSELEEEKRRLEKANKEINNLNRVLKAKIKELKRTQDQIIQTEKLAVAGRLAAGVSHELNNPAAIIINRIECLLAEIQDITLPDEIIKDLETVYQYAHKISVIVKDLSVLSRTTFSKPHFEQVDINDILTDVFFLVEQKIQGKPIRLIRQLHPDPLLVMGDSARLEQVFTNIIDNAIDAIADKGWIRVSTKMKDDYVRIKVADSGVGIPQDYLNKIYEPFFTTKEVGKGTGLGLTISYAIIKDHNGSIDVENNIKTSTSFTVILPRHPEVHNQ